MSQMATDISAPENALEPQGAARLSILTKEQALSEWDVLGDLFALAIPSSLGRRTIEGVRQEIEDDLGMVVIAWDPDPKAPVIYAAFLIESEQYGESKKVFNIALCGGSDIEEWGHLFWQFRDMAKELDFNQIEIVGRAGWSKFIGSKAVRHTFIEELA